MAEIKRQLVVVFKLQSPGVFHCFRNTGEPPFAELRSPKAAGGRKWAVTYRDPKLDDPFSGPPNQGFKTKDDAIWAISKTLNTATGYQLGLEDYVKPAVKVPMPRAKIIPHMCLICDRNTSGCDHVAFYSDEGELAGSAMLEYSAQVLTHRNGHPVSIDPRLAGCRVKFEYADECEDTLPTSFQMLIKKTRDDIMTVAAAMDDNADELFHGDIKAFERFWIRQGDDASGLATLHDWLVARYYVNSEAANAGVS